MRASEMFESLKDLWNEFKKIKSGRIGLAIFIVLVLIVILEPFLLSYSGTNERWNDIGYWQNLPMNAPPVWAARDMPGSEILKQVNFSSEEDGVFFDSIQFIYYFDYGAPPDDLILYLDHIVPRSTFLSVSITIPEMGDITILSREIPQGIPLRIPLARDADFKSAAYVLNPSLNDPMDAFFSEKGDYSIDLTFVHADEDFHRALEESYVQVLGKSHGLLGTDNNRRDLWSGVIAGTKWALLIGVLTAIISVLIGVLYGITSAYFGGVIDSLMQRIYEIMSSIPLLPLMIVIAAIFRPNIWLVILLMCIFYWTGSQKTVRAMALQVKEETFIEASRGFGAGSRWIIFRHMLPLLLPYTLAMMALTVPMAIVYEATLSLLGLGDSTIVTWGQILGSAVNSGAIINSLWWWVIPPGIAIVVVGMAFAFIGFALDTIVAPRLKTL
jgi:ABC-type dipeptide/oligopeptide/nickel transport systems, permease components